MDKPILTAENYYDDNFYMSTSRFKNYIDCEAKALAIDNGVWEEEKTPIQLVVGNYVHSYFESPEEHQKFLENTIAISIKNRLKQKWSQTLKWQVSSLTRS